MKTPTILDGGMSRELIRLEAPFRQPEWSSLALIEAPNLVLQVHKDFLAAGADIITTNSYAIVPFHIGEERFWQDASHLAALSGRLAREAADGENAATGRKILVAGSLPPIFGSYEPAKFNQDQTLSLIAEAKAAHAAVSSTQKPFWVAFTPDDGPGASVTSVSLRSGESITKVVECAISLGADALLFNCARPEYMDGALQTARSILAGSRVALRIGIYANAFIPRSEDYAANEDICPTDDNLDPEGYLRYASKWASEGVEIIGGCCGVGREHIELLSQRLNSIA